MAITQHGGRNIFIRRFGHAQADGMESVVFKRSILIDGRKTSVSLENEFWDALHKIAEDENVAVSVLVEKINEVRSNINLSSALHVFVLNHYRPINGAEAKQNPHSGRRSPDSRSLRARAEECRALADNLKDAAAREIMLGTSQRAALMAHLTSTNPTKTVSSIADFSSTKACEAHWRGNVSLRGVQCDLAQRSDKALK
jgi:predicted DNA-binding ribbon-helix-helix protein